VYVPALEYQCAPLIELAETVAADVEPSPQLQDALTALARSTVKVATNDAGDPAATLAGPWSESITGRLAALAVDGTAAQTSAINTAHLEMN
jgi:hypothetical protein